MVSCPIWSVPAWSAGFLIHFGLSGHGYQAANAARQAKKNPGCTRQPGSEMIDQAAIPPGISY
jgi:hypothetical protein